jgi:hypothetical protein
MLLVQGDEIILSLQSSHVRSDRSNQDVDVGRLLVNLIVRNYSSGDQLHATTSEIVLIGKLPSRECCRIASSPSLI